MVRRGQAAQSRVERGQVSRARHELTGAPWAPKNEETLAQLRGQRPQEQIKEIPRAVLEFQPDHPLNMNRKIFHDCLRGAPSGVASGPGGCTNEMLRGCLDDEETISLLFETAEDFARGQVPPIVCRNLMLATMTALQKRTEASPPEPLSVDSWQRFWHASSATNWKQLALHCSLHCRPGRG